MAMPAERLAVPDQPRRTEREFEDYARGKVDRFMEQAGLTKTEHDVYWERVGYMRGWRETARLVAPADAQVDIEATAETMRRAYRLAHRKLVTLVVSAAMYHSPLHPNHRRER